jgi:hypothetical protein
MIRIGMLVLLSLPLLAAAATGTRAEKTPPDPLAGLGWIAGSWQGGMGGRTYEEQWLRPAGGTMIGMSRTLANGKTVAYEFLQIRKEGEDVFYVAQPNGGPKTPFKLVKRSENEAVFENKEHDFPQRILYRRDGDSLVARIEGEVNGKLRAVDFPMKRAPAS